MDCRRPLILAITISFILVALSPPGIVANPSAEGPSTREMTGRIEISTGLPSYASYSSVEVGDADEDGKYEIYLGGAGRTTPKTQGIDAFEYNPGNGQWAAFGSGLPGDSSGKHYGALGIGDINDDDNLDVVAPIHTWWYDGTTNGVEIYTGNGAGTFSLAHTLTTGTGNSGSSSEVEIADVDDDTNMDIVVATGDGIRVWFGSGSATSWTESSPAETNIEINGVGVGDLNQDGLLDLVGTPYFNSVDVRCYTQGASRSWSEQTFQSVNDEAFGIKILNVDGDSYNDVVMATRTEGIEVWKGNGGGSVGGTSFTWTAAQTGLPNNNGRWHQLEMADINGDTKPDIIAATSNDNKAHVYINNLPTGWTEEFTDTESLGLGGTGYGSTFGDWDGDGELDMAGCSWGGGARAWRIDRGTSPNIPPTAAAGDDLEVSLGNAANLDGTGSADPEDAPSGDSGGTILTYDWNVTGTPGGSAVTDGSLSPSDSDATPTFTPDAVGDYTLTLRVRDTDGAWSATEDTMVVTVVEPINQAPTADAGDDISQFVGITVGLDGTNSSDPEDAPSGDGAGTILTYDWNITGTPGGSAINDGSLTPNDSNAKPQFTPDMAGTFIISLRVMDTEGTWSTEDSVNVVVSEQVINSKPTADAGDDQIRYPGDLVTLDGSGSSDPEDGSSVQFNWTVDGGNPSAVSLTNRFISGPGFTAPDTLGDYTFTLEVGDTGGLWSDPDQVTVHVIDIPNQPPTADAGSDFSQTVNNLVTLDGSGSSDPDGSVVNYNWSCTSHYLALNNANSENPTFTPTAVGEYLITLGVQDDDGDWSTEEDSMTVTVLEEGLNLPPSADAGVDQSVTLGDLVTLDGSGSSDQDGSIVTWEWECTSHDVNMDDANSSSPSFIPSAAESHVIDLRVMDNEGAWSTTDTVMISVSEPVILIPPEADAGVDKNTTVGQKTYLDGSGSTDTDGTVINYNWTCTSHTIELTPANSPMPSFTPHSVGIYMFTLKVGDNHGLWSTADMVNVTATEGHVNQPPSIELTYPTGGEELSGEVTVTWTASDPDGDSMVFTVSLSNDSGATFTPLTDDDGISGGTRQFIWDTRDHTDGDSYRVRVTAVDTAAEPRESSDESDDIIISNEEEVSETFTIRLGPFLYTDGTVMAGITVRIHNDTRTVWESVCDSDGFAEFVDVPTGDYSGEFVEPDTGNTRTFSVQVGTGGAISYPDPIPSVPIDIEDDDGDDQDADDDPSKDDDGDGQDADDDPSKDDDGDDDTDKDPSIPNDQYDERFEDSVDSDKDGIPDWYEEDVLQTDPDDPSDTDEIDLKRYNDDKSKNAQWFEVEDDSDGDGLPDWWEVLKGFDPDDPDDVTGEDTTDFNKADSAASRPSERIAPDDDGSDGISAMMIVVIITIVVVVVVVLVAFIMISRKKTVERDREFLNETSQSTSASMMCNGCGGNMEYNRDFKRYHCSRCGRYQ